MSNKETQFELIRTKQISVKDATERKTSMIRLNL